LKKYCFKPDKIISTAIADNTRPHQLFHRTDHRLTDPMADPIRSPQRQAGEADGHHQCSDPLHDALGLARGHRRRGGQRRRTGEHRDCQREYQRLSLREGISALERLVREHHPDRDQQQDHAAGHLQRALRQVHQVEERPAAEHEGDQDRERDEALADGDPAPAFGCDRPHHRHEHRQQAQRIKHQQQEHDGGEKT
jgi:hypothetical protein